MGSDGEECVSTGSDPVEIHSSSHVAVPNVVGLGRTVWVQVGVSKKLGTLESRPLGMECG